MPTFPPFSLAPPSDLLVGIIMIALFSLSHGCVRGIDAAEIKTDARRRRCEKEKEKEREEKTNDVSLGYDEKARRGGI